MTRPLHIYLQDHLAGSTFGLRLAERCWRSNAGTEFAEPLAELVAEIAEDRRTLLTLMREVGAKPSRTKVVAAWAAERARHLKPNGKFFEYTPLDRELELESLAMGITGKRALWLLLEDLSTHGQGLGSHDFAALAERAAGQFARVEELRIAAGRIAFASRAPAPV